MFTYFIRIFLGFLCIANAATSVSATEFVVGTTSAYAPYVSLNEQGEYIGFDIDFANELGKKLDSKVVIKDLGCMPSLFLALKQGKVDALIWAISITAERQKQMEMVYYQGPNITSLPMLFWKKIPENVSCIEDMAKNPKAVIAVEAGSSQDSFLRSIPNLNVKQVEKVMDSILEIKYGKSMASIIDPSLVPIFTKQFPEIQILDIPLPPSEQSYGHGVCLNKQNSTLITAVRKAVEELRREGKIAELEKKWNLVGG